MAANGAWNRANMDLVVARVEDDVLEVNAPSVDNALGVGGNGGNGGNDGNGGGSDGESGSNASGGSETASEIEVSEDDSILTDDGEGSDSSMSHISTDPSTDEDGAKDDDNDSIVSEPSSSPKVVRVGITRTVINAIVDDDQSAEADANARVEIVENRLDESVAWEEYETPAPVVDAVVDEAEVENALRPYERAQLLFDTNLVGRLRTFEETGVVEPLLVQMLTHG